MVGANYMGGKRNTARTKSKDIAGRAQRRHFGKQRLASALCVAQENRVHTNAPTLSFLPEIALAHARRDAESGATSSSKFGNSDQLYSSRSLSSTVQRNKPSKVLGALDTSDQDTSIRAAIDCILNQPTLIGINAPKVQEYTPFDRMKPPAVRRSTRARLASRDSDTQYSQIVSKHTFNTSVTCPEIPSHGHTGVPALPDSPSRLRSGTPWGTVDDSGHTEAQLLRGVSPFYPQGNEPDKTNTFLDSVYPLPRSSPFPSSSQSSDNSILDLDTSPLTAIRFERPDDIAEADNGCMDTTQLSSVLRPMLSRSLSFCSSAGVDGTQSTRSPFTDSDEGQRGAGCNNNSASPSTKNDAFRHSFPSGHDTICVLASQEVTEHGAPSNISIDFLSDPHPWETIGRILKLKPAPSATESMTVSFTKDREGVGYVSLQRSNTRDARSSDAIFFETGTDDRSKDDVHVVSSADTPIPETVDLNLEVPTRDARTTANAPESPCADDSIRPLFDMESPSTPRGEVDPRSQAHVQEAPCIPVIHCIQDDHSRSSSPVSLIAGTTTKPDDMMFAGPCLFGDSDLEDE